MVSSAETSLYICHVFSGERDSNKTFQKSYDATLKPHHNWMVQKLFSVGLKMVPDFEGFVELMAPKDHPGDKVTHTAYLFTLYQILFRRRASSKTWRCIFPTWRKYSPK